MKREVKEATKHSAYYLLKRRTENAHTLTNLLNWTFHSFSDVNWFMKRNLPQENVGEKSGVANKMCNITLQQRTRVHENTVIAFYELLYKTFQTNRQTTQ